MTARFKTRILSCSDCGEEFIFTAEAQEYFVERGKKQDPERCKACHHESRRGRRTGHTQAREQSVRFQLHQHKSPFVL